MLVLPTRKVVMIIGSTAFLLFIIALIVNFQPSDKISSYTASSTNPDIEHSAIPDPDRSSIDSSVLLVQFNKAFRLLPAEEQQAIVASLGGKRTKTYPHLANLSLVSVISESAHFNQAVSQLRSSGWVTLAEPNYIVTADAQEVLTWGLHNDGQSVGQTDADIDAPEAWDKYLAQTDKKSNTIVAVLDSG